MCFLIGRPREGNGAAIGYESLLDQVLDWQAFHDQVAGMAAVLA